MNTDMGIGILIGLTLSLLVVVLDRKRVPDKVGGWVNKVTKMNQAKVVDMSDPLKDIL